MWFKFSGAFLLLFLFVAAQPTFAKTNPETLALKVVSEKPAESAARRSHRSSAGRSVVRSRLCGPGSNVPANSNASIRRASISFNRG